MTQWSMILMHRAAFWNGIAPHFYEEPNSGNWYWISYVGIVSDVKKTKSFKFSANHVQPLCLYSVFYGTSTVPLDLVSTKWQPRECRRYPSIYSIQPPALNYIPYQACLIISYLTPNVRSTGRLTKNGNLLSKCEKCEDMLGVPHYGLLLLCWMQRE